MAPAIPILNPRSGSVPALLARLLVFLAVTGTLAGAAAALGAYAFFARDLPAIPPYDAIRFGAVSQVRSAEGMLLGERFEQRRYLVPREAIPKVLVDAVMASEDDRFFEHGGLDLKGILRAAWSNLRAGTVKEGASTLTQQVARALLLHRERSLSRKVREAILARRIEDIYTKDQILALYLNLVFLGQGAYGVRAAADVYFGKDLDDLTLGEAAVLAALPQSPSRVTPVSDPAEMRVRRDRVLRRMRETGRITDDQEEEARAEPVRAVAPRDALGDRAPFAAVDALQAVDRLAAKRDEAGLLSGPGGVTAWSTVDVGIQRAADEAVRRAATALARRQGWPGPVASLPPGNHDAFRKRNRAWLAARGWTPAPPLDRPVLALVTAAGREDAALDLGTGRPGRIALDRLRWAAPYQEFPVTDPATGKRRELPRVSLDGRIDAVDRALRPGDVVLVRRVEPPAPPPPPPPPKRKKGRRGDPPPPEAPPPVPPAPAAVDDYDLDLFPRVQAAAMVLEPRSGYVLAEAGSTDWDASQVPRTRSVRQTGSAVKPVYYAKAYDLGIPPSAVLAGAPFREGDWLPEGGTGEAWDLTLWEALTRSENPVSLRVFRAVLDRVGVEGLNEFASRLGWGRPFQGFPAEALGADAAPADLLRAYGAFAARGVTPDPVRVSLVRDGDGRVLLDRRSSRDPRAGLMDLLALEVAAPEASSRRALSPEAAYLVARNLRSVAQRGTAAKSRALGRPLSGKTGTLPYDVWFAGWTREAAAVAWVGQDRRERYLGRSEAKGKVFGADTAMPLWLEVMAALAGDRPPSDDLATPPPGVVEAMVDPRTGLAVEAGGVSVPHLLGTEPAAVPGGGSGLPDEMEVAEF